MAMSDLTLPNENANDVVGLSNLGALLGNSIRMKEGIYFQIIT